MFDAKMRNENFVAAVEFSIEAIKVFRMLVPVFKKNRVFICLRAVRMPENIGPTGPD